MQTQLQTQNPKSSPALPPGRTRRAAGLARTLGAAALLADASVVWGQQTYTGPLELKFEPQPDGTLRSLNGGDSAKWTIAGTGGRFCVVTVVGMRVSAQGILTDASIGVFGDSKVQGSAHVRLKDGSQLPCKRATTFEVPVPSPSSCLKASAHPFISSASKALKEGFTLVLTPKTFSCS